MRESIGTALYCGLMERDDRDTPVTRIAAFSMSPRLGTLLWRLKYANDAKAHKPAMLIIASKLPRHFPLPYKQRVAEAALREWLHDSCRVCNGARELVTETLRIACTGCEGSGKHRYSDKERERNLGGPGVKMIARAMAVITGSDIDTCRVTTYQLERT
jgi:hypothetical protein